MKKLNGIERKGGRLEMGFSIRRFRQCLLSLCFAIAFHICLVGLLLAFDPLENAGPSNPEEPFVSTADGLLGNRNEVPSVPKMPATDFLEENDTTLASASDEERRISAALEVSGVTAGSATVHATVETNIEGLPNLHYRYCYVRADGSCGPEQTSDGLIYNQNDGTYYQVISGLMPQTDYRISLEYTDGTGTSTIASIDVKTDPLITLTVGGITDRSAIFEAENNDPTFPNSPLLIWVSYCELDSAWNVIPGTTSGFPIDLTNLQLGVPNLKPDTFYQVSYFYSINFNGVRISFDGPSFTFWTESSSP